MSSKKISFGLGEIAKAINARNENMQLAEAALSLSQLLALRDDFDLAEFYLDEVELHLEISEMFRRIIPLQTTNRN